MKRAKRLIPLTKYTLDSTMQKPKAFTKKSIPRIQGNGIVNKPHIDPFIDPKTLGNDNHNTFFIR